jgi:cyanate lyase
VNEEKSKLGKKILAIKAKNGWKWPFIAAELGYSPVWTCAACLGQMSMLPETAVKAAELFGLSPDERAVLEQPPYRGSLPTAPPSDPLIYRFYEVVSVYGTTFKQIIEEEFGDGIMSAIDFNMSIEREPDPKGERVRIVMSGKFLPYKRY